MVAGGTKATAHLASGLGTPSFQQLGLESQQPVAMLRDRPRLLLMVASSFAHI